MNQDSVIHVEKTISKSIVDITCWPSGSIDIRRDDVSLLYLSHDDVLPFIQGLVQAIRKTREGRPLRDGDVTGLVVYAGYKRAVPQSYADPLDEDDVEKEGEVDARIQPATD